MPGQNLGCRVIASRFKRCYSSAPVRMRALQKIGGDGSGIVSVQMLVSLLLLYSLRHHSIAEWNIPSQVSYRARIQVVGIRRSPTRILTSGESCSGSSNATVDARDMCMPNQTRPSLLRVFASVLNGSCRR